MTIALRLERRWTAKEFVSTDQSVFGPLWRYELVDGVVIGHAAPSPEHGAIITGLVAVLVRAMRHEFPGCRVEVGSAATPRTDQSNTARIPDVTVRCGEHPKVVFEVVSPSEIRDWRDRDSKRKQMQAVIGLEEIVEIYQSDYACHSYRRTDPTEPASSKWAFDSVGGRDSSLPIASLGIELFLSEIYEFAVMPERSDEG